ncbi:MAG: hypothetical protein JSV88_33940 [Candidatus Aminicenantes bacterium]|nr:MAG: hypothetical protein JSV88_33940 [Candidatus Aminicenantes bacterium]
MPKIGARKKKNQEPVEYPGILSYIIGMMNKTFFPVRFDAAETGRLL